MPFLLFVVGLVVGGQINRAIYEWAWNKRLISPWSPKPKDAAKRTWADCIPVWGWWLLRRESKLHGKGFWVRPMLLELGCAFGLAALYHWVVVEGAQLPAASGNPTQWQSTLHWTFLANAILFGFMAIATFIDFDEKTIPDYVTLPGTIVALLFAVFAADSFLPVLAPGPAPAPTPVPILLSSPNNWPVWMDGTSGLIVGFICWLGWCYGLLPKTVYFRRGVIKGICFLLASIRRHPWTKRFLLLAVVGLAGISAVYFAGGSMWQCMLSSLVGMAFGGGLVWAIRIVSRYVLGVEAMGFGDVTLMAMIGAFLGWQAALVTFFLAPFTSLLLALSQWLLTGRRDIPFGPFLCAGAAIVMIGWGMIWERYAGGFAMGLLIPAIIMVAIALMGIMLALLQVIKRMLGISY